MHLSIVFLSLVISGILAVPIYDTEHPRRALLVARGKVFRLRQNQGGVRLLTSIPSFPACQGHQTHLQTREVCVF